MFKKYGKSVLVLCAVSMLSISAQAHRSWILPSSTQVEGKEPWITVDAAVSENLFDIDARALELNGLSIKNPDGTFQQAQNAYSGKFRSSFDLKLAQPGTYTISMVNESVAASYKLNGETKRWRGTEETLKKEVPADATDLQVTRMHSRLETFATNGKAEKFEYKPSNNGLVLIPIDHPNDYGVGAKARFRVLLDGKPIADQKLSVVPGGVRYRGILKEMLAVTDSKGEFSITWPEAGMYWISASYPARPQAPAEGEKANASGTAAPKAATPAPEKRVSYSGTFEVLP